MAQDPNETCWTVLRAASSGDQAARSTFSRTYLATIRSYLAARWRGRIIASEVDDATQEVFVECLKPGGVLERADAVQGDFRGLLFGVARNVARRFEERGLQRGLIRSEDSQWMRDVASDDPGQATIFDRSWARSLMRQSKRLHQESASDEAGQRRLELLERRHGDGEPIREIAVAWGVPAQEVHNAYRKARAEFYACLREVVAYHALPGTDLDAECRRLLASLG